jgi:hypothetical protein
MAQPGDLSSKKVKNTYTGIVQHDGGTSRLYDGTGSRVESIDVTRITASKASITNITDLAHLTASKVQVDTHLSVSGSTVLGDNCGTDTVKVVGNTWITGSVTVSGSCQGSFRSIGQAKFIYLDNPVIEDQKPAKVTRGMVRGQYNVPRFGGQNAALDVYGNMVISGSLIVQDTVFAQEFHSEHVSSSIIYTSGSTKFGNDFSDTMTVTGSIFQSGSDVYFLNGVGIGTTGSNKAGAFTEAGQDNPVQFTHLLRMDDPGHDGLQHKSSKLIYGTFGSPNIAHVSASDVVRFRDKEQGDDVFVISSISQSVFFSTNDKYNVGIGVPSGSNSKVDENLVVSSSTNARVKIESATSTTSASLYLESGQGVWEIAAASSSTGANNQLSESLVFRTRNSRDIKNTFGANSTFTEALRLNNRGRAGFNIPSANLYDYPQQVQISGSLNIVQGRTIDINAGTFHDSDGINGIHFNNQKMIHVSGSGQSTSYFFGYQAGNNGISTSAISNIGIGYQVLADIETADYTIAIGALAGAAITTGGYNLFIGTQAGTLQETGARNIAIGGSALYTAIASHDNIAIGTSAMKLGTHTGQRNIALGYEVIKTGTVTGNDNIALGTLALEDLTTGVNNVAIGTNAGLNLTIAQNTIAIGQAAIGGGTTTGNQNIGIGHQAGLSLSSGTQNIYLGSGTGKGSTTQEYNIAIGSEAFMGSQADADENIAIGKRAIATGLVTGIRNIGIGSSALDALTGGANNIAIGYLAADGVTVGNKNIAIGEQALSSGTVTGDANIALGVLALNSAQDSNYNIGIGYRALRDAIDGAGNIAIGYQAGFDGDLSGNDNILIGTNAAANATTLKQNVIIGHHAAQEATGLAVRNVILGVSSSAKITTGKDNIIVGSDAGNVVTTNTNNILIGSGSTAAAALSNAYAIGTQASVTQADSMVLGGQTGTRFKVGIGGVTAPNAILEVSGTLNVTGSAQFSGSATNGLGHEGHTLKTIGTTVMSGTLNSEHFREMRALEVSGTTNFRGNMYITGNLFVSDIIVAQEFHTEFVSASIAFSSGSNNMGNSNDDMQMMTGSFRITGSGFHYFMGRQNASGVSDGVNNAKVGINTMIPDYALDVVGDMGVSHYIHHNDNPNTNLEFLTDKINLHAGNELLLTLDGTSGTGDIVTVGDGGDVDFQVKTTNDDNAIYVLGSNDMVGIGMNNPTKKLHVTGDGHFTTDLTVDGNTTVGGDTVLGNAITDTHTFEGHITASHNISASLITGTHVLGGVTQFGGNTVTINGPAGHVTASGNISASGYISSSHFAGTSASFNNLIVTGSGLGNGTGSFGYVYAHTVEIHNHEIVGGQGLSVIGASTTLGIAGQNDQPVTVYGNITGSNLWMSGSSGADGGGHISASSMTLTNHLTILGDISGSFISASKGFWTAGEYSGSSLHVENGISGSYISASKEIYTAGHITASGNISSSGYIIANRAIISGHVTASGNISSSGYIIAQHITASGNISASNIYSTFGISGSFISASKEIYTSGHISASGNITASGNIGTQGNLYVKSDLTVGVNINLGDGSSIGDVDEDDVITFDQTNRQIRVGIDNSNVLSVGQSYTGIGTNSATLNPTEALQVYGTVSASGDLHLGHGVDGTGDISISGSIASRNYRSFYIAAAGMTPSITNGASTSTEERPGNASGDQTYPTVDYLAFDGATNEAANFQITMPGEWDLGTIKAKFYFMTNTATTNTVKFNISAAATSTNEVLNSVFSNIYQVNTTPASADDEFLIISGPTSAITVQNTPTAFDLINFQIARNTTDTYTGDAHLLGISIQYREHVVAEASW